MVVEAENIVAAAPRERKKKRSVSRSKSPAKKKKKTTKKSKSPIIKKKPKKVSFKKAASSSKKNKRKKSPACVSSATPWDLKDSDMHGEDLANPELVMENGKPVAKMKKGAEWHLYRWRNKGEDKGKLLMWAQPEAKFEGKPTYSVHEAYVPANKQVTIKDARNAKAVEVRSSDPNLSVLDKNRGKKFLTKGRANHKAKTRKVSVSKAPRRKVTILKKDQPIAKACIIEKKIKKKAGRPKKK